MDKACKFLAQFYAREKKYIEVLKKNSRTCTLYNRLDAWNIVSKVWAIV